MPSDTASYSNDDYVHENERVMDGWLHMIIIIFFVVMNFFLPFSSRFNILVYQSELIQT